MMCRLTKLVRSKTRGNLLDNHIQPFATLFQVTALRSRCAKPGADKKFLPAIVGMRGISPTQQADDQVHISCRFTVIVLLQKTCKCSEYVSGPS